MPFYKCDICDFTFSRCNDLLHHKKSDRHIKNRILKQDTMKNLQKEYDELLENFNKLVELIQGCDTPDKLVKLKTLEQLCD